MEFIKKVLVLKQVTEGFSTSGKPVSGIFRLELENGVATASLSIINLSSVTGGEFYAFILDGSGALFPFELGLRPFSVTKVLEVCPSVKDGFAVGISFIKDDLPTLIAFATDNGKVIDMSDFKKAVIDKCIADRRFRLKTTIEKPDPAPPTLERYDDEVVATENYYLNDKDFIRKLNIIESMDDEYLRNKDSQPYCQSVQETQKEFSHGACAQNETAKPPRQEFNERNPYYDQAKPELDAIFDKFQKEETLSRMIADSKWARIYYSETKFYVVGLVKEKGVEKYICYGVPARYSPKPPKELDGFCSFIPLSLFDMKGDGYWMMFQSAITGECVKINN